MEVCDMIVFDETLGKLVEDGLVEESLNGSIRLYRIKDRGKHWFTREQILHSIA